MSPRKKPNGFEVHDSITIEVDGGVIGKIKNWDPKPLEENGLWPKKYTDFVSRIPSCNQGSPGLHQVSLPVGSLPKFFGPRESSGKSNIALNMWRRLLDPGHMYVRAQLEMWGVEKTKEVCFYCLAELTTTLEDMGYEVEFDEKPCIDEEFAEAHGVIVRDYKLNYVGRGKEDDS